MTVSTVTHAPVAPAPAPSPERTVVPILAAISVSHLLNDTIQSLIPAIYPILKESFALDFAQIGLISLAFQATASLFQPVIGLYADRRPQPFSLSIGMGFSLVGLIVLSVAPTYGMVLLAAALVGLGSAVFHPESSRVARMASGGRHGLAQAVFQVGGNAGHAIGPLLAAFIVLPNGRASIAWFSLIALAAIAILGRVGLWYRARVRAAGARPPANAAARHGVGRRRIGVALAVLVILVISKQFYLAGISSYYTFYLIDRFGVGVKEAQVLLFVFLGAVAVGTVLGGPIGDRFGRKYVIWGSILGVLPFTVALPYADFAWTIVLSIVIGVVIASAFSAIVVFGQELLPGRVGAIAGLFYGFAFGMSGLGAALLGELADRTSLDFVFKLCSFLPAIGLLTILLPNLAGRRAR